MSGHTKEPWSVDRNSPPDIWAGDQFIGDMLGGQTSDETDMANACRAVACVNALAGYNPAALAALVEAAEIMHTAFAGSANTPAKSEAIVLLDTALTAIRAGEAS